MAGRGQTRKRMKEGGGVGKEAGSNTEARPGSGGVASIWCEKGRGQKRRRGQSRVGANRRQGQRWGRGQKEGIKEAGPAKGGAKGGGANGGGRTKTG